MVKHRKNTFIYIVFLLMVFSSKTVFARSYGCPEHTPSISLAYKVNTVEYIRDVPAPDLAAMHLGQPSPDQQILGLAGGDVGIKFETDFEAREYNGNSYCLIVKNIEANFFAKPKIFIASNFKRGSCEYYKVMHHEEEHVRILKRAHRNHIVNYRKHLRNISYRIPVLEPVELIAIDDQKRQLIDFIGAEMVEYLNIITEDVAEKQKEIDTPEEYRRVYSKCSRWEEKLSANP